MEDKKMKVLKGQIPVSILYIALGVCLALMPVETVNVLCKVVFGLVLVGAGLYHIVIYVLEKENATILDLFSGVIVLVIGAFLFMNPQVVVKLLTLMLGAFILVDSIWMLRGSMKLRKRKLGAWKAFLIESLVFVGLGVLCCIGVLRKNTNSGKAAYAGNLYATLRMKDGSLPAPAVNTVDDTASHGA